MSSFFPASGPLYLLFSLTRMIFFQQDTLLSPYSDLNSKFSYLTAKQSPSILLSSYYPVVLSSQHITLFSYCVYCSPQPPSPQERKQPSVSSSLEQKLLES